MGSYSGNAVATERQDDRRLTWNRAGKFTAQKGYDVILYANEADACAAVPLQVGDQHPESSLMTCSNVQLIEDLLTKAHVICTFDTGDDNVDLNKPPIIGNKAGKSNQQVDTDLQGNAITNSAFDPFSTKVQRQFSVRYISIKRYVPYFDQASADAYMDTTNSDSVAFPGFSYTAGQVYCHSIGPTTENALGATPIQVAWEFECRSPGTYGNLTDKQKRYPFQYRVLDQGKRGYYTDPSSGGDEGGSDSPTKGVFYLADGHEVTHDVLLNGDGTPVDTSIMVTQGQYPAVSQTIPNTIGTDQVTLTSEGDGMQATFLIYQLYPEVSMSGLVSQLTQTF